MDDLEEMVLGMLDGRKRARITIPLINTDHIAAAVRELRQTANDLEQVMEMDGPPLVRVLAARHHISRATRRLNVARLKKVGAPPLKGAAAYRGAR